MWYKFGHVTPRILGEQNSRSPHPLSCRRVDVRLSGKGSSNSHGARPDHLIIGMIKWIRTSRLSERNPLFSPPASGSGVYGLWFTGLWSTGLGFGVGGFEVWSLGFGFGGLGCGVWGVGCLGFGVWGLGSGAWVLEFGVWGLGSGVWGLGCRVQGAGFREFGLYGRLLLGGLGRHKVDYCTLPFEPSRPKLVLHSN